jgi:hypothetical protein
MTLPLRHNNSKEIPLGRHCCSLNLSLPDRINRALYWIQDSFSSPFNLAAEARPLANQLPDLFSAGRGARNRGIGTCVALCRPEAARESDTPRNAGKLVVCPAPCHNSAASPELRQFQIQIKSPGRNGPVPHGCCPNIIWTPRLSEILESNCSGDAILSCPRPFLPTGGGPGR